MLASADPYLHPDLGLEGPRHSSHCVRESQPNTATLVWSPPHHLSMLCLRPHFFPFKVSCCLCKGKHQPKSESQLLACSPVVGGEIGETYHFSCPLIANCGEELGTTGR